MGFYNFALYFCPAGWFQLLLYVIYVGIITFRSEVRMI